MIMCVLLCYPVSFHMLQLLLTGRPISSFDCYIHPAGHGYYFAFFFESLFIAAHLRVVV